MPQFHKMEPGSTRHLDYIANDMELAKKAVQKGMALGEAAKEFNVSQSTLTSWIRSGEPNKPGRPPVLSTAEENIMEKTHVWLGFSLRWHIFALPC